jgi:hypothetical protein
MIVPMILAALAGISQGAVIFQQAPQFPGNFNAYISQDSNSGGQYQTFDDFRLINPATITSVTFQGLYYQSGVNFPAPNSQSFTFSVFDDTGPSGLPGNNLFFTTLGAPQVSSPGIASFLGNSVQILDYTATLNTPFMASANKTYWLSIFSVSSSAHPNWNWTSSQIGNGSAQFEYSTGSEYKIPNNRAFSLSTSGLGGPSPVPEPSTLALAFSGGVIGLSALARRRRRNLRNLR